MNRRGIRLDVNPQVAVAAAEVGVLLEDYHYSPRARADIVKYIIATGMVDGAPGLDAEDQPDAEMVFEQSLPRVPFDGPAWDVEAAPFEPSPEDWADYSEWSRSLDDRGDFPRLKSAEDHRQDRIDTMHWFATHPGE